MSLNKKEMCRRLLSGAPLPAKSDYLGISESLNQANVAVQDEAH
jgi:hypothetical protein